MPSEPTYRAPVYVGAAEADSLAPPVVLVLDGSNGNKQNDSKNGDARAENGGDKRPENIKDNGFLIEEAYNQEPGVVQHIFNWVNTWNHSAGTRQRDFAATYTMELPLGTQRHQFSFTTQFITAFEHPSDGPAVQQGDIGDTFLNYRYQLRNDEEGDLLSIAPRFSLILPTGDERLGIGDGTVGFQFNLPISKQTERFAYHFNAGLTFLPNAEAPLAPGVLSPHRDLHAYNLGGSVYWLLQPNFHPFIEVLALRNEEIDDTGFRNGLTQVFLNPGFRHAICQLDQVEWVVGVGVPIGLTRDSPDIGVFAYMSVEHHFRKKNDKNEKKNDAE